MRWSLVILALAALAWSVGVISGVVVLAGCCSISPSEESPSSCDLFRAARAICRCSYAATSSAVSEILVAGRESIVVEVSGVMGVVEVKVLKQDWCRTTRQRD